MYGLSFKTPQHNSLFAYDIKPFTGWRKLLTWLAVWAFGCVFWTGVGVALYHLFK